MKIIITLNETLKMDIQKTLYKKVLPITSIKYLIKHSK